MSAHLFEPDSSSNPAPLRSQRMTADEAKAVIDLWQRERDEQTGLTDRPAVPDVAEGLDIDVEDVQRLLADVRERRADEERALAYEQELAEIRLAEEERKLAEVKRQRAELRREQANPRGQIEPRHRWVEVKLGIWEEAAPPELIPVRHQGSQPLLPPIQFDDFVRGFLPGFVAIMVAMIVVVLMVALSSHFSPIPVP
jgi:hypothetical protein